MNIEAINPQLQYDESITDDSKQHIKNVFNYAYHCEHYDNNDETLPYGYVYRVITSDNQVYIGKRKIQAHTDWFKYLGSGAKLNTSKVIRKEFICFGFTQSELHSLECKHISDEISKYEALGKRELVLNMRVNVTDSSQYGNKRIELSDDETNAIINAYNELGTLRGASVRTGFSMRIIMRTLHDNNVMLTKDKRHDELLELNDVISVNTDGSYMKRCIECHELFNTDRMTLRTCSHKCLLNHKRVLSDDDYDDIMRMFNDGYSLSGIGAEYGTNAKVVSDYLIMHDVHIDMNEHHVSNGSRNMHLRWHVRRNQPDYEHCEYCMNGFNSDDIVKANDRIRPCLNPYCPHIVKSHRNRTCSHDCRLVVNEIMNLFQSHVMYHVNRNMRNSYCYYCMNDISVIINDDMIAYADGIIKYNEVALKHILNMREDGCSYSEIASNMDLTKPTIRRIMNNRNLENIRKWYYSSRNNHDV